MEHADKQHPADYHERNNPITIITSSKNHIILEVPCLATNGDMVKIMFPDGEERKCKAVMNYTLSDGSTMTFDLDWWNSSYSK